jgi:hypothetical protein
MALQRDASIRTPANSGGIGSDFPAYDHRSTAADKVILFRQ